MQPEPIRILLAEDNMDHAELTIDVLREKSILNDIFHVTDGEAALRFIEEAASDRLPHLVLLDIKMPRKSGIEVLRVIKSDQRWKHIPTVMLSTSENAQEIEDAYSIGANSFISKPVGFDSFMKIIASLDYYWTITAKLPRGHS